MVPITITPRKKTPRKKRVRFLDEVQADSSRPRASYTPPPTSDADIMKFIHKKAADQRRAKVNRMAGVAFGQQALRSYTAAQKKQRRRASRHPPMRKKKPAKPKTCLTFWNWHRPLPTLPSKCVFIPNNRPSIPWWDASLAANRRWPSGYKRTLPTLADEPLSS